MPPGNFRYCAENYRNITHIFGKRLKLALVKSEDLFDLPELHGGASVRLFFVNIVAVLSKEGEVIIILPIQTFFE